ncbi:hypothetical protein Hanom_Chr03g00250211 [Helianthus anomalus]
MIAPQPPIPNQPMEIEHPENQVEMPDYNPEVGLSFLTETQNPNRNRSHPNPK